MSEEPTWPPLLLGEWSKPEDRLAQHVEDLFSYPKIIVREEGVYIAHSSQSITLVVDGHTRQELGLEVGAELEEFTVAIKVHGEREIKIRRRSTYSR